MAKHKIGVIGAGARGEGFSRQLFAGMDRAELFGICDLDEDRLGKFVDYCGLKGARTFTDPAKFFASPEMDAVMITTPDFTHRDVALQAMAAGKHIYLEKPIANTIEACRDIIEANRKTNLTAFVGFNMRAIMTYERMKQVVDSGILGQITHIEGLEQLSVEHSASFMRRFHRKRANTGGFLNHKCSHDLDIILWLIGHQHKITKIASFAGLNVFVPSKAPAKYCHECAAEVYTQCPYKDQAGFVFPVSAKTPIHHRKSDTYGADLCVYTPDKDTIDNQTVIMEWDNGVRGNFNLQLFQHRGKRETRIWGEMGVLHLNENGLRTTMSRTGDVVQHYIPASGGGGHGGSDPRMINRFVDAIEGKGAGDSNLSQGMAATVVAVTAMEAAATGKVINLSPETYL